jgi:hypothetical protein
MNPKTARQLLTSRSNRLAGEVLAALKRGEPTAFIRILLKAGASDTFLLRDDRRQRSQLKAVHLLDELLSGESLKHLTSEQRLAYFGVLLDHGFPQGDSGWRRNLFARVYSQAVRDLQSDAVAFAEVLSKSGRYPIAVWAHRHADWARSEDTLNAAISLGLDPTFPGLLETATSAMESEPDPASRAARADVITRIAGGSATPAIAAAFPG